MSPSPSRPGATRRTRQGIAQLKGIPGVGSVEPLQHRFAYIGADLQDLYGVRPQTITSQGKLQNGVVRRRHRGAS